MLLIVFLLVGGIEGSAKFFLLSRDSPQDKIEINQSNLDRLNGSRAVKFIVHGWGESAERPYYHDMTDAYLLKGDYSVVQVDWKDAAATPYLIAVRNTKEIGSQLGKLIMRLVEMRSIPMGNIHIIGHSLGGHVSGFAGKTVRRLSGSSVGRISGLDPAGPSFEGVEAQDRLDATDAELVDVTHTDGGVYGYKNPLGTVDFFPNGGTRIQPGCLFNFELDLQQLAFCSHTRSYHYFIESINSESILGTRCDSYEHFKDGLCKENERIVYGENVPAGAIGSFYFRIDK